MTQEEPPTLNLVKTRGQDKSLMVLVGDHSADRHIVSVLRRIKEEVPDLKIWGVGGERMAEEGVELMYHVKDFAVIGIVEVIKFLPIFNNMRQSVIRAVHERKPDLILMVDFGGFNLQAAQTIHKQLPNQKIEYFISPQVWASRPWRIKTIAANVSKMLVIFPFEETLYKSHGVGAKFVGHPLLQHLPDESTLMSRGDFAKSLELNSENPLIAVMPGSRKQEIRQHLPIILKAIAELVAERPHLQFVISRANASLHDIFEKILASMKVTHLLGKNIFLRDGQENYNLFKNVDIVWAKSGTTALEVTMFGKPMIVFYRANWLTFLIAKLFITVKYVSMPNILAGRTLVPELIQLDCRAEQLVRYTRDLLDVPGLRNEVSRDLLSLKKELGSGNYVENCAREVLTELGIQDLRDPQNLKIR